MNNPASRSYLYALLVLSGLCYLVLGYLTPRSQFWQLLILFGGLFGIYWYIIQSKLSDLELEWGIRVSILFRFILLFSLPNLSDDYFRFVWDGRLWSHDISPFSYLPSEVRGTGLAKLSGLDSFLYNSLNSKNYYSVYPPILQYIFRITAWIFPTSIYGSVLVLKGFIFTTELGSMYMIRYLLRKCSLSKNKILIYGLNPLVIVELTGNVHFEAFLIFFVLLSVACVIQKWIWVGAVAFAFAICSKFIPFLFLLFLPKWIGWAKSIKFFVFTGLTCLILFIPLLNTQLLYHITASLDLYFQKFEFNAGLFYLFRCLGMQSWGYDIIAVAGPAMMGIVVLLLLRLVYFQKPRPDLPFNSFLHALTIYLAFSTTVHPWYMVTLVVLSLFTEWKYPLVWSACIVLSYSAYHTQVYAESMVGVVIEYLVVFGFLAYEYYRRVYSLLSIRNQS
jgi:alpha-1,6-mannosyltransferase